MFKNAMPALMFVVLLALSSSLAFAKRPPHDPTSGGGQAKIATFGIATQAPGSMTFSVSTSNTGPFALAVTDKCYDSMSALAWTDDLTVVWDSSTVGHAGPTSPPQGLSCFAYVHDVGSNTALAVVSYVGL